MFLKSAVWNLPSGRVDLPVPHASISVPDGDHELWREWKTARLEMEKKMSKNTETTEIKKITYVACDHWFKIPVHVQLEGPFVSGWATAKDEDPWFASCGKWETIGLLFAVVSVALRTWLEDRTESSALRDAIACAEKASEELDEWRHKGNVASLVDTDELPDLLHSEFFQTSRELGEILYGMSCLSRAKTPEEVCDRAFSKVVLSAVLKAEDLLSRAENDHDVPEALEDVIQQTMLATIVSVAMTYYECAEKIRVLDPPRTVGWNDVVLFLSKASECVKKTRCFEGEAWEHLTTELRDNLNCAVRLDEGFIGEWRNKDDLQPKPMPIQEKMPFPF